MNAAVTLLAALLLAPAPQDMPTTGPAAAPAPAVQADDGASLHRPFGVLLATLVHDGKVEYGLWQDHSADLDAYLETLAQANPASMDREGKLAFWINAYNAFTLKLILDHEPVQSIRDIPSSGRWKAERWTVAGEAISLNRIEHEVLRPMGDPRIHFAIVCASVSCPDLASEVYLPATIDRQLDAAAQRFLANPSKGLRTVTEDGALWGQNHVLYLSAIFDWFDEDFEQGGSLVDWVATRAPAGDKAFIRQHRDELKIKSLDYDWSLNGRWDRPAGGKKAAPASGSSR